MTFLTEEEIVFQKFDSNDLLIGKGFTNSFGDKLYNLTSEVLD